MTVQIPAAGYKPTEVGVIPEDWHVKKLSDIASFRTGPFGSALHKSDYITNGVPVINPMHIIDGQINPSEGMTITEEAAKKLSEFRLTSGEVIIGRRGEMGRCAVVREGNNGWLCGTGSMIIRPKNNLNPEFLQRILASSSVISAIEETSVGSTMINLNQSTLGGLWIQAPSLVEQQAIAEALSDTDALIESLEQLIAKKRQIKQGAMQDLLTGQRRLPGFSGEWGKTKIGELLVIRHGKSQKNVESEAGEFPILASGGQIGWASEFLWDKPSVLIGRKGTINKPQYIDIPFWTVDTLFYSEVKKEADAKFLYYKFCLIDWMQYNEASGVPSLNAKTIENLEVNFPLIDEQEAISSVLTEMDNELLDLETRLAKARQIKQGMMQELLTGRIRLIENHGLQRLLHKP